MWSCIKTLGSIKSIHKGETNELIFKFEKYTDLEMFVKTICFKINNAYKFTMYSIFKNTLAERGISCDQAIRMASEKLELSIIIPAHISPYEIYFYHVGKKKLGTTRSIQQ
jgi:hypothetical protein